MHALAERAQRLEAEIAHLDRLLLDAEESDDEPEPQLIVPDAKRPSALFTDFLNPRSPFYQTASRRTNYLNDITPRPMKDRDLEALSTAVRKENQRLEAIRVADPSTASLPPLDLERNLEGLDWTRIAERVSDTSSTRRSATECRITWIADRHPDVNHSEWSKAELAKLNNLVAEYQQGTDPINWTKVAEKLATNRTPLDCMRHGVPRQRHSWTPESDKKLLEMVERYGIDNWQLVALKVSEHATPSQCQNHYFKSLDPTIKRGAWSAEEDELLQKAVAGYGHSWINVAASVPGRTNDQCRERWMEHVSLVGEGSGGGPGPVVWTEEEDKKLLELVGELGNQWKVICTKFETRRTGQQCRQRVEKLKRKSKGDGGRAKPKRRGRADDDAGRKRGRAGSATEEGGSTSKRVREGGEEGET